MKKVSLLVDVQNIYYTTRSAFGKNFDYNRFWARATEGREVVNAFAYAVDRGDAKQKQFQNILRAIGFQVKLKPFITRADGSAKGDWDVGITIDALDCAPQSDLIVLASGDGDFAILVKKIISTYSIPVEIYGVQKLTASSLAEAASIYHPIESELLIN